MGESHGSGTGPTGFGGAGCAAAVAGAAALAAEGAAGAGFDGTSPGVAVLVSATTDPTGVAFTPPEAAGSAVGFASPSGGGEGGDLVSSGIARERGKPPAHAAQRRTITFISLRQWCQREPMMPRQVRKIVTRVLAPDSSRSNRGCVGRR